MKALTQRRRPARGLAAAVVVSVSLLVPTLPATASAAAPGVTTISIRGNSPSDLHFVGPKKVREGSLVEIVNETDPGKVGPQTFSLVEKEEIPITRKQQATCLSKGHICKAIMGWNGIKNGRASKPWFNVGQEGWGTAGNTASRGDSWFTNRQGQTFSKLINAGAVIGPVVLTYMSAFDPALHGSITVVPF